MKHGLSWIKSLSIIIALAFSIDSGWAEIRANPHSFERKDLCSICHKKDIPELNHDPVTTCIKCHSGNIANHPVYRHPIMVGASRKVIIPLGLPLTSDDKIVCYTCHDYHNTTGIKKMLWLNYNRLCVSCHVGK